MNFKLKSWDVFSWTAMRDGLFRLDNDFQAIWVDNNGKVSIHAPVKGAIGHPRRFIIKGLRMT